MIGIKCIECIASTYKTHYTETYLPKIYYTTYKHTVIHNTQNYTQCTYRVNTTSLKENYLYIRLVTHNSVSLFRTEYSRLDQVKFFLEGESSTLNIMCNLLLYLN